MMIDDALPYGPIAIICYILKIIVGKGAFYD
jgi:hypothetical protein